MFKTVLVSLILLVSCSKKSSEIELKIGDFFSNRAQTNKQFIALVKLKSPALLESSEIVDNKAVITDEAKEQVNKEQEEFIKELEGISKDIKVINRYKLVLNGVAFVAPISLKDKLTSMRGVSYIEEQKPFARPNVEVSDDVDEVEDISKKNSVTFINAHKAWDKGIRGKGITVGVIDTGVDYTHKMFAGVGTVDAFKAIDPSGEAVGFPNEKIVGGIDLVGTEFNANSLDFSKHIPKPDNNPIDEGGHGTHVAGSVAGIGDNEKSYDGVAPDALIHAIKVFGKNGSTSDTVIIASLEYSADPNMDLDVSDRLDVVNLSLGSGYGKKHILYTEAIRNLVRGGTVTVASAGNSGHIPYIVGAPSTVDEAISVAASIDNMKHNVEYKGSLFTFPDNETLLVEAVEGSISKQLDDIEDNVIGKMVSVGTAHEPLADDVAAKLKGNIALIDRGLVTFSDKFKHAKAAGAIGVIVANNREGDPIAMGGEGEYDIPGIMITLENGNKIKEAMKAGDVELTFKTDETIKKPFLVDNLTSFSSRGPRMGDALLKPEIAAPGYNIISAAFGKGAGVVKMSGTSMSAPHMAGVMALMVDAKKGLSPKELKSMVMGSAKNIADKDKKDYPVAMQGAGRVQVDVALETEMISTPAVLSFGINNVENKAIIERKLTVKNITEGTLKIDIAIDNKSKAGQMKADESYMVLSAGEKRTIKFELEVSTDSMKADEFSKDLDGHVLFKTETGTTLKIPYLAVVKKISRLEISDVTIQSSSPDDSHGKKVEMTLSNLAKNKGEALLFNMIDFDGRKVRSGHQHSTRSVECDLQVAGYKVIEREEEGEKKEILQVGVKTYNPNTRWQPCEVVVLIDGNSDGVIDQELVGIMHENFPGLEGQTFNSLLLDAKKVREMRLDFEKKAVDPTVEDKPEEDYKEAVIDAQEMKVYDHSTIAVIEADVSKLQKSKDDTISVKIAVLDEERGGINPDDFLQGDKDNWRMLNLKQTEMGYSNLPETLMIEGDEFKTTFTKGSGEEALLMLYPHNMMTMSRSHTDRQMQVIDTPTYLFK